jgi:hypothetical protein
MIFKRIAARSKHTSEPNRINRVNLHAKLIHQLHRILIRLTQPVLP